MKSWPWPGRAVTPPPRSHWPGCDNPDPVIPIIGARKLVQVQDNLACVGVKLAPVHVERLHAVSRIEMGAPHDLFATDMMRSLSSGGMRDQIDA